VHAQALHWGAVVWGPRERGARQGQPLGPRGLSGGCPYQALAQGRDHLAKGAVAHDGKRTQIRRGWCGVVVVVRGGGGTGEYVFYWA
jgi:hypothetical protein